VLIIAGLMLRYRASAGSIATQSRIRWLGNLQIASRLIALPFDQHPARVTYSDLCSEAAQIRD